MGCRADGGAGTGVPGSVPPGLASLRTTSIEVAGRRLTVAVADTPATRARGLMDVADLGSLDGMLFVFPAPTDTSFYMQDVRIPLDIAFVSEDGSILGVTTMALCQATPCPTYLPPAPFRWAIETPAGGLGGILAGDRFVLDP